MKTTRAEKVALIITGITIIGMLVFFIGGNTGNSEGFTITTQRQPSIEEVMRGRDAASADGSDSGPDEGRILVNINTATEEMLCTLPGIGPVIAGRIVEYREETGGFASILDILAVRGIGEKVFENILEYITVSE